MFSIGLNKTADGYQEEGVMKLLKDIRDNLAGGANRPNGNVDNRPDNKLDDRPDNRPDNRPDDRPDDRPNDKTQIIKALSDKINCINNINKQYEDTQSNIKKHNDYYLK